MLTDLAAASVPLSVLGAVSEGKSKVDTNIKINSKFEIAEKSNKKSNSEISSNKEEIAIDPIIEQNSVFDCVTINVDFTKNIQFPIIEFKSN